MKLDEIYGGKRFTSGMGMQKGCILTIKSICDNAYLTEYDTYEHLWTDEMFENINKNNKEDNNMNEMNNIFNMEFGGIDTDIFRISMNGLAIKVDDKYVSFDIKNKTLTDVTQMSFDAKGMLFKIPCDIKNLKSGDIIINNGEPLIIISVGKGNEIEILNPSNSAIEKIILTQNMFGFTYVSKVVNLMDFNSVNPIMFMNNMEFNPMMFMMGNMDNINPMMIMYMMSIIKNK